MESLVIGGAGFIGSHLVEALAQRGRHVSIIDDLSNGDLANLAELRRDEYNFINRDIVKDCGLWQMPSHLDEIYYMACFPRQLSFDNPQRDCEVNLIGVINALEVARKSGAKLVFASNTGIVSRPMYIPIDEHHPDQPSTPYDCHKLASEHMLRVYSQTHGIRTVVLRFASVYGSRQHINAKLGWHPVIPEFASKLISGKQPTVDGSGEQTRAFVYVKDLVDGIIAAMESPKTGDGEMFILGTETETSILNLYSMIAKILNVHMMPQYGPAKVGDIARMSYDCSKARLAFGWNPCTPLKDGLKETIQSYSSMRP